MVRIILVDDHKVFLQGLESLLSSTTDFIVTGTFTASLDMMRFLADGNKPDVLFLDIEMGTTSGIELAENVLRHYPEIRIIILSTYLNEILFRN